MEYHRTVAISLRCVLIAINHATIHSPSLFKDALKQYHSSKEFIVPEKAVCLGVTSWRGNTTAEDFLHTFPGIYFNLNSV